MKIKMSAICHHTSESAYNGSDVGALFSSDLMTNHLLLQFATWRAALLSDSNELSDNGELKTV